jgi:VWFA-related protein
LFRGKGTHQMNIRFRPGLLFAATALAAFAASADVQLRVEGRPFSAPIQAFVKVTDANGNPISGLTFADFTVTLDGAPVPLQPADLTLPPSQDPNQRVSVVFAMDYSMSVTDIALTAMQDAVLAFIDSMADGDYAAIIKFNDTNPNQASVVQSFTAIDHGANSLTLETAVMSDYPGDGTNILDAIILAVDQFAVPPVPLPDGPKAVIVVTDGGDNRSAATEAEVIASANDNGIAVFTVGVGDLSLPGRTELLTNLAAETSGDFFPAPDDAAISDAYASISELLNNEYVISFVSSISDCAVHTLIVAVAGQAAPASVVFTRRICDTTPNSFAFTAQTGVAPNTAVNSNTVTIAGIEVPADISVINGSYSIGCGAASTFTTGSGTISDGQTVCVRQQTSGQASTTRTTTLTVGSVAVAFTTTTRAAANPGGGGGGGATGLVELLLGLSMLLARRRGPAT